ncbi:DeoR/GlpR family DNA-binding transcription regulator [Cohnella silvisoli]|uniref:DeoR/GlpR family DNA-binding transcription regulator n=1 Tax=Cohnella silvisoli TaxID=2873699 RepID=A0ABV1KWS1_9BACL|nr:DeoR/GlpR family DNA-binding transcription regulator [Cohnella silvisoli]MCD9023957.1 DeoR/GlpR family DNA-binding transcription regulator [Cohnella silvisoli]
MFAQQRHKAIIQKINEEKSIKVPDLMQMFGVSIETIRRDLEYLEKEGFLKRVHGGAMLAEIDYKKELPFAVRETTYRDEKNELAEIATRYVSEGQSIAMDVSTTNTQFAKALKNKVEWLTVITNSLPIVNELVEMPHYTIILTGGVIRNQERCVVGDMAEAFVSQFHVDTFFMSISGVSLAEGVTSYGIGEVEIQKRMLKNAKQTIVLGDSSKFEAVSLLKVCNCTDVDRFITDSKISRDIVDKYAKQGIEIVYE